MNDSLVVTAIGVLLIVVSLFKRPIPAGYISATIISLWPAYGVFMPSGAGLFSLILILIAITYFTWRNYKGHHLVFPAGCLFLLSILILIRDLYDGNGMAGALVLTAVSAIMFLTSLIGQNVLDKGFWVGFAVGGSLLAITEIIRVATGGMQHAKAVSFEVNPIVLGQFIAIGIVSSLLLLRKKKKAYLIILLMVMFGGILATGSRGPMMGVIAAVVLMYLLNSGNGNLKVSKIFIRVAVLGYGIVFAIVLMQVSSSDLLTSWWRVDDADGNAISRWRAWSAAGATFLSNPVFGAGAGNYYYGENAVTYGLPSYPHQMLLEVAAEYGIIAATLLIVVVLSVLLRSGINGAPFVVVGVVTFSFSGSIGTSLVFGICLALALVAGSEFVEQKVPKGSEAGQDIEPSLLARSGEMTTKY